MSNHGNLVPYIATNKFCPSYFQFELIIEKASLNQVL